MRFCYSSKGNDPLLSVYGQNHGIDLHSSLGRQQQEAVRSKKPLSPRFVLVPKNEGVALRSSGLCLLCHFLGGFDSTAPSLWFFLRNKRFLTGHLLSSHRFARGRGLKPVRKSSDLRSNAGIRLFNLDLDRLVEKDGDLLNCLILRCLLAIRAFHREPMDLGGDCLQLSFFITPPGSVIWPYRILARIRVKIQGMAAISESLIFPLFARNSWPCRSPAKSLHPVVPFLPAREKACCS